MSYKELDTARETQREMEKCEIALNHQIAQKQRREKIAVAVLPAVISRGRIDATPKDVAFDAVKVADALIAELDKKEG